jgi:hypothetical protein
MDYVAELLDWLYVCVSHTPEAMSPDVSRVPLADDEAVMRAGVYNQRSMGQPQSTVQDRLPTCQAGGNRGPARAPAEPPGTDECRYYRTNPDMLSPAYRLCFTGGRLSHKDTSNLGY